MRTSTKNAYLALASVTALVTVAGMYFLTISILACIHVPARNDADSPYTLHFFFLYSLINACFLAMLAGSSWHLFHFRHTGVSLLSLTLKLELLYWLVMSFAWFLPVPFGMSAAAATGIGNMGIAPQLFIAYPVTALLALWILKRLKILSVEQWAPPYGSVEAGKSEGEP